MPPLKQGAGRKASMPTDLACLREPLAHIRRMEKAVDSVIAFLMSVVTAAFTALSLAYIAHYNFGLSRQEIRTSALAAAAIIAMLMAVEFFGKKLRKPK
jgi:hypothetical protein